MSVCACTCTILCVYIRGGTYYTNIGSESQSLYGGDHVLDQVLPDGEVDLVVSTEQLQHVRELSHRVTLLNYDLLGPVD